MTIFPRAVHRPDFGVMYNKETDSIVATGTMQEMRDLAIYYNRTYQTTAYRAKPWKEEDSND